MPPLPKYANTITGLLPQQSGSNIKKSIINKKTEKPIKKTKSIKKSITKINQH